VFGLLFCVFQILVERENIVKMIRLQLARPKCIRTNFSYIDFVYY